MAITGTTRTGYTSRLGSSLTGIIIGLILCLAAIVGLWWNEGDSVATEKSLEEGQGITKTVADITCIERELEGQLIHMTGRATTADVLTDPQFNVTATGITLKRCVEYYQWVEHEETETYTELGGAEVTRSTYTYAKEWKDKPVDSSGFKEAGHANKVAMQGIESMTWRAKDVKFGAFRLNENQIGRIGAPAPYSPKGLQIPELYEDKAAIQGQMLYLSTTPLPKQTITRAALNKEEPSPNNAPAAEAAATVKVTVPPAHAEIGDMRITWKSVGPEIDVSLIAVQKGDTFAAYVAKNGKTVNLITNGIKTMPEMYKAAHLDNLITTWIFRLVGWLALYLGIKMILRPLDVLISFIPFLEKIVGFATGLAAFILSLAMALLVIAVAWLFYRPVFAVSLLVIVMGLFYLLGKRKNNAQTQDAPET